MLASQLPGQWEPLPNVQGTRAFSTKTKPIYTKRETGGKPTLISEIYIEDRFEYNCIIFPDTIHIEFNEYELDKEEVILLPRGMVIKDEATHNIKYLNDIHGLPSKHVNAITEDEDGLIYIGMENALGIYDGDRLTIHKGIPEFLFTEIRSLLMDKKNRLWIATATQVCFLKDGKLHVPSSNVFGGTHLKGFNENRDTDEVLIFTIYNGLFVEKDNRFVHYKKGLPIKAVSSAIRATDGRIWMSFGYGGAGYIENDSLFILHKQGVFNTPRTVYEWNDEIWIGFFEGPLTKCRNDSLFRVQAEGYPLNKNYSFDSNEQGLWMVNYGTGVYLVSPENHLYKFNSADGLVGNISFAIHIDQFDNVWVADPANGISRIDANTFHPYPKSIKEGVVTDIEHDSAGLWYFRSEAGIMVERNGMFEEYDGIGAYCEYGLILGQDIWASSADHGLSRLSDGIFTSYRMHENIEYDSTIYSIQKDECGGIWGWNFANKLYRFYEDSFFNYSSIPLWKTLKFNDVVSTRSNTLFALTINQGVIAIKDGNYLQLSIENSLNSNRVSHVFENSDGDFWFCMDGQIQVFKRSGSKQTLNIPELKNNTITDVLEIEKNKYMATTAKGILSIHFNDTVMEHRFFGIEYGKNLIGNTIIRKDLNGNIILGGAEQLMQYDPYFSRKTTKAPKLSLNKIVLYDSIDLSLEPNSRFDQESSLKFIFNNIFWGGTSKLFYQLNRNNREANWNKAVSNTIPFNDLTHGTYELSVYAEGDGEFSEQLQFNFEIKPYWYQTSLAHWGFIGLVVSAVGGFFYYREKRARAEQKKLKELVDHRTEELRIEKNEVIKQLAEKEILMQEVHHRVKNNLTFLKSLLYLRAKSSDDERVRMILDECQSRVQSMALVHQNLYDVEEATMINFQEFLKELFSDVSSLFDQHNVRLKIEAKCMLSMQLSIFLGLIINELLTNTFKYAYDETLDGKLHISFTEKRNCYSLSYDDNGKGLPPDFDIFSSSGFGFKLIRILLDQIDAKMSLNGNPATNFKIEIPK